ncbi:MDR family MFS transporter [Paramicrobacterium chengjingii]|uniref:Multidrug efflux MFS transporter n=1 Tax=Paramicrobacterium chengjingii TaxID=2769067 RepID=A0ABX6YNW0_9MICO|nr:MDR family MFS transporter [Microbacterium chengjingii]QPZ40066.1 multidrug efflux MFS transporter [Microbacterium chengjingii]
MTDTLPTSTSPAQSTGKLLTALIVGGITAIFDTTIVAVGLHTLTDRLNAPIATIQWVSTGYLLALAVAIPFVSWAQARLGGKRLWLFALGFFVLGSILCACAWNAESLIAFRVVQGLGGGIMFPLMQTLAMQNVAPQAMARTMAIVSLPIALGPILGPVLGGVVLHWLDWHWLFLINVPLGVAGLILAFFFISKDRPHRDAHHQRLDLIGVVLLVPALAGLLYGLSNVHAEGGFSRADVLFPIIIGAVMLVAFTIWAMRRAGAALIDVRLLAQRSVRASSITLTFLGATLFASTFLLPLYFQTLRGADVLTAALLLIPQGVGTLLARLIAGKLVDAVGPRIVALVGFLVIAAATVPFALTGADASVWLLGIALFVRGFGLGVVLIPVMTVAYVDIRRDEMPHASAITRIVQQLGGAFGTALVAVVLTAVATQTDTQAGFQSAFWWTIAITIAAAIASVLLPSRRGNL